MNDYNVRLCSVYFLKFDENRTCCRWKFARCTVVTALRFESEIVTLEDRPVVPFDAVNGWLIEMKPEIVTLHGRNGTDAGLVNVQAVWMVLLTVVVLVLWERFDVIC